MIDLHPRLLSTVTAMQGRVGPYPSLRYSVSHILYQTVHDIAALAPIPPIDVIHEEKNRRVTDALTHLGGYLAFTPTYNQQEVLVRLQKVGSWISDYILPRQCFCCCHGTLPHTIEIITDQHEIPWELTWVNDNFLAQQAVCARYPFVSRARLHTTGYSSIPRLAIVVGRADGLFSAQEELYEIREVYQQQFHKDISIFQGPTVTVDFLRNLLASTGNFDQPFDIIHFIGHGDSQADQVWLELLGSPFLGNHIPPMIGGNPLIFWNSCFSGSSIATRYRYQADVVDAFGGRLLSNGASHFIGPLFPILDSTAKNIAVSFYSQLFSGIPVGIAFFNAKIEMSKIDPIANTYVLYGNPAMKVVAND